MNENEQVMHFMKKVHERLTFLFRYYIPNGKQIPESDRDLLLELYKIYDDGRLESMSREPMQQEDVIQTELFAEDNQKQSDNEVQEETSSN